jgi:hypothetical protein
MPIRNVCPVCFSDEHLGFAWCPDVRVDESTGVRVFQPSHGHGWSHYTTGEAYDFTQTCEDMRDGDVIVAYEGEQPVTAVLIEAWPTAVIGGPGEFHELAEGHTWELLDGGKYLPSVEAAQRYQSRL